MATLSNRLARTSPRWRVPLRWLSLPARALERTLAFIDMMMDVFAESQEMARKASKRYPFREG